MHILLYVCCDFVILHTIMKESNCDAAYDFMIDDVCAASISSSQNQTWIFSSPQNAVIVALSSKSWDVETATELLLSN